MTVDTAGFIAGFEPGADPPRYRYEVLADHFTELINSGVLPPKTRLPSEVRFRLEYGASLHTVRRVMRILRERGLVVTVYTKGTFVAGHPVTKGRQA